MPFISYKKYINEKFSEDSDPISDLGIGMIGIIKKYCNLKDINQCLLHCAQREKFDYVEAILDINPPGLDLEYEIGKAFRYIAYYGNAYLLKKFINKGIDINIMTWTSEDALLLAIQQDHYNCVKILIENGAKISEKHILDAKKFGDSQIKQLIQKNYKRSIIWENESLYNDILRLNMLNESLLNEDFNIQKIKDIISKLSDKKQALYNFIKKFNETNSLNIKKKIAAVLAVLFLINFVGRNNSIQDVTKLGIEIAKENKIDVEKLEDLSKKTISKVTKHSLINYTIAKTTQQTKDFIKHHEKLILNAYIIKGKSRTDNKITIGYGHAYPEKESPYKVGDKITIEKAEQLFKQDVVNAENGIKRMLNEWKEQGIEIDLTQNMFDAMVSICFNTGVRGFRNTEFIHYLKKQHYKTAAEKIKTARISSNFPGLEKRRLEEYKLFTQHLNNNVNKSEKNN